MPSETELNQEEHTTQTHTLSPSSPNEANQMNLQETADKLTENETVEGWQSTSLENETTLQQPFALASGKNPSILDNAVINSDEKENRLGFGHKLGIGLGSIEIILLLILIVLVLRNRSSILTDKA